MVPRNLSRYIILVSSLAFVALTYAIPLRTDALATHLVQGSTPGAYCSAEAAGNVVYISKIFDVVAPPRITQVDTSQLNFAFKNYLVEEYEFKSNANFHSDYSAGCRVFQPFGEASQQSWTMLGNVQVRAGEHRKLNRRGPFRSGPPRRCCRLRTCARSWYTAFRTNAFSHITVLET